MWGLITALVAVGSLIAIAQHEAAEPTIKPAIWKLRLARLAALPRMKITLDQAEDGVILSRRLGEKNLEKRFEDMAKVLRKKRPKVKA
jgi:hypothetical protein